MAKRRVCKDCGTDDVIYKVLPKMMQVYNIETELCAPCLQSRAQLQTMKEDKLPFPKLLAKIRREMEKDVHNFIKQDRIHLDRYVGKTSFITLSTYWTEQLTQGAHNG
jgi:hypothetical protein